MTIIRRFDEICTISQVNADRIRGLCHLHPRTPEEEQILQDLLKKAKPVKIEFHIARFQMEVVGCRITIFETPEVEKGSFADTYGLALGVRVRVQYKELTLSGSSRPPFKIAHGVVSSISDRGKLVGIILLEEYRGRWVNFEAAVALTRWDSARLIEVNGRKVKKEAKK
jgi:hypothetical protein